MSFPMTFETNDSFMFMDEEDLNEHMMLATLEVKPITISDSETSLSTLLEEDCLVEDFEFFQNLEEEEPQTVTSKTTPVDPSVPTKSDVLCGQSRACADHAGNKRFQVVLDIYAKQYDAATTKQDKMSLTKEIVATIKENGGRFMKFKDGAWMEISDVAARDKVSHALRTKVASWKRHEQRKALAAASPVVVTKSTKPTHRRRKNTASTQHHRRSSSDIFTNSFDSANSDSIMDELFRGQTDIFDGLTQDGGDMLHPLKK